MLINLLNHIKKIEKLFYIGGAIFISKIVFLFIPYLISDIQYNSFNKIYYSAAIVVLFGKLGFEFAISRINLHHKNLFIVVFINTLITTLAVIFFNKENDNFTNYTSIFIYSFFYILANIFLIKNLFEGSYKKYFSYKLFYGIVLFSSIFILLKFTSEIFLVFPVVGLLWFLFIYSFNWSNFKGEGKLKDFYKLGISGFVINATLGFAFIADKYIINHFFELDIANAYTFGWALTAPMLYIGSMIEHSIFTANNKNKRKTVINAIYLLVLLIIIYGISVYSIVSFYPNLLPASINYDLLKSILILFLVVYAIYAIIQFPLNGILFKFTGNDSQFKLAKIYPAIFLGFITLLFVLFSNNTNNNYWILVVVNASYLFLILGIKAIVIKKSIFKTN